MNGNTVILCIISVLLLIMLAAWIVNLVRAAKNKHPIRWLGRIVYISGIVCILLNAVRSWHSYETGVGLFITAHLIALFSILSAFIRSERQSNETNTSE